MIRIATLFILALLMPFQAMAYEGTLEPPVLVPGQYVYTIPSGYAPAGLSLAQQQQLNGELGKLHNPFYVVLLKNLPVLGSPQKAYGRENGFRGTQEGQRIEITTAMLMEDWAVGYPDYNAGVTSVFVLSFEPRKFAWHPGLNWINQLGIKGPQQKPYTKLFMDVARTRPADYGRAMANLATKLDTDIFDRTDPTRVAQLAEVKRVRTETEQKQRVLGTLSAKIVQMNTLLRRAQKLSLDGSPYQEAFSRAQAASESLKVPQMQTSLRELRTLEKTLEASVEKATSDLFAENLKQGFKFIGLILVLMFTGWATRNRWISYIQRRDRFKDLYDQWIQRLSRADDKWASLYLEREALTGLDNTEGTTLALWREVTADVDEIQVRIQAMKRHVASCMTTFKKGGFWNLGPLNVANQDIRNDFTFDTGTINQADLFGGDTVEVQVNPSRFAEDTERLFANSVEGWKTLLQLAEVRKSSAAKDFPHTNLDLILGQASKAGIPESWCEDHPLFGDDASDQTFYDTMDALRESNPRLYQVELERVKGEGAALALTINELESDMKAVQEAAEKASSQTFSNPLTTVSTADDPKVAFSKAQREEQTLQGLLALKDAEAVAEQAMVTQKAYAECLRLQAEISASVKGAEKAIKAAHKGQSSARPQYEKAVVALQNASKLYSNTQVIRGTLDAAFRHLSEGAASIQEAENLLKQDKHLDAQRKAKDVQETFTQARSVCKIVSKEIALLDATRQAYHRQASKMSASQVQMVKKMNRLDTKRSIAPYKASELAGGPQDYGTLNRGLLQTQNQWRKDLREAESAHEAEKSRMRRQRDAEVRQERQEREEERRLHSSYHSSHVIHHDYSGGSRSSNSPYSSASGSSFGGSSEDSGGSSYGGGGFGGSSGDSGGGGFGGDSGDF